MSKAIKSTDPIKAVIVKLLKAKSGGTRVTKDEDGNKVYAGDCMENYGGFWGRLGTHAVHADAVINAAFKARK